MEGMTPSTELNDLFTYLRFPSISTDPAHKQDMHDCAQWLSQRMEQAGLSSRVHPTGGHPVVVGKNPHREGRPTVLIYGHYDVQPPDPLELWTSPPFEPRLENGILYARGAADNKGQNFAHLMGVEATIREHGELPVNVTFLVEGEEEIGSPHLIPFLQQHSEELACDVVAISDTGMEGPGIPTFTYGLRGIACLEVTLQGPSRDLHSGIFGGAVANPLTELCRMLALMHDANHHIRIDGFYDDVRPLEDWERKAWNAIDPSGSAILRHSGSPALCGEAGYTPLEHVWGRPTAEINGMGGGYQGEGFKTVLPSTAKAKVSFRLVPDQDPGDIREKVEAFFKKHAPGTVTLSFKSEHGGKPYRVDPHSGFGKAAQKALSDTFGGKEPVLIREGGSIPIVADFKDILGVDTLLLGLALPDAQVHSPDENFPVENFEAGISLNRNLLRQIADQ